MNKSFLIVIPAHNEEVILTANIGQLVEFCRARLNAHKWHIVIAENGSIDNTAQIARAIVAEHEQVLVMQNQTAGKGAAIRAAWAAADDDLLFFMDADLSTDLEILPRMITALENGTDVVVGSRLIGGAKVSRGLFREVGSRFYNLLARAVLNLSFRDFQCGCKGITQSAARKVLPRLISDQWFMDTELLAQAKALGLSVEELPVHWVEHRDTRRESTVSSFKVFFALCRELVALRRRLRN